MTMFTEENKNLIIEALSYIKRFKGKIVVVKYGGAAMIEEHLKQNFAQVTNPPIDPIREEIVMSLVNYIGKRGNILDINSSDYSNCIKVNQPILKEKDINKIISFAGNNPKTMNTLKKH